MAGLPTIVGEFRTTADPELRFTPAGKAVANVTVIASERIKDQQTGEWSDGDKSPFIKVAVWGQAAEALAEHVVKGERVLVTGQLYQREYDKSDGTKGLSIEIKFATVAPVPGGRPGASRSSGQQAPQQGYPAPASDPWATPAPSGGDEPPF